MRIRFIKTLLGFLLVATVATAVAAEDSCDFGEPNPASPPEFSQYAFLVGDFDINIQIWQDGQWYDSGQTARWDGRYDLDGLAIVDVWTDFGYPERPESGIGVNVRMWDADKKVWKMMWQHTGKNEVKDLRSQVRGEGRLVLWQVYPMAPERKIYFESYEDGSWARIEEKVDETTEKWVPSIRLLATARPCD
jgi:hypothetical protein